MDSVDLTDVFPNGLHDAEVESLRIDDVQRIATMTVYVWVGSLEEPGDDEEAYRQGTLEFRGLYYCEKDVPFATPAEAITCRFWVEERNDFVHLAAQEASFSWDLRP